MFGDMSNMGREIRARHDGVFVPKKWLGTDFFFDLLITPKGL